MRRREALMAMSASLLAFLLPLGCATTSGGRKRRLLFFTRNVGYYHDVVKRKGRPLSVAETELTEIGTSMGIEIECSKDGRVFDGPIDAYDAFAFFTNNDLTEPNEFGEPPMSLRGKQRLLEAVRGGTGFMGFHSTCGSWRTPGEKTRNSSTVDPFIAMIGGEFLSHGPQQEATIRVVSPDFPGVTSLAPSFRMMEEWYAVKNLARDVHVILAQETAGMKGASYDRPPYPSTWARLHGRGRVFFTTMAHRADAWQSDVFHGILRGGLSWILKDVDADVGPNLAAATPGADTLKR